MKYSTSLVLGALLSLSSATPVERRDADITSTVVMTTTVWVDVVETVNGFPPAQNKVAISSHLSQHAQGKAHNPTFTPVAATPTSTPTPAFTPDVKAAAPPPPPSSSTSSSYVPANSPDTRPTTGGSPEDIQNAANKKQEQINAQQKAADFAHQDQMNYIQNGGSGTPQSSVAAPTQQAPSQPSPQPQQPASSPVTGSSQSASGDGGNFPIGKTYTGDATMYNDQGAGACGETYDTHSEDFFALAPAMFDVLPSGKTCKTTNNMPDTNKNVFCGRQAAITVNDKTVTAKLTDRCGGCKGQSDIDLSDHLYQQLFPGDPPLGSRHSGISWHFTTGPTFSPPPAQVAACG